jgi:hypothetical protein
MEVVHMLEEAPADVRRAADALRYNMVRIILIGVNNPSLLDKTAVYVPDPAITPHRICYMGYFSSVYVTPGKSSFMTEITTPHWP